MPRELVHTSGEEEGDVKVAAECKVPKRLVRPTGQKVAKEVDRILYHREIVVQA